MNESSTTGRRLEEFLTTGLGKRIPLPEKLSLLRQKLSQKAKQEPKFRFYALYDRIYLSDTANGVHASIGRPFKGSIQMQNNISQQANP